VNRLGRATTLLPIEMIRIYQQMIGIGRPYRFQLGPPTSGIGASARRQLGHPQGGKDVMCEAFHVVILKASRCSQQIKELSGLRQSFVVSIRYH
jgi:hypothetical protein